MIVPLHPEPTQHPNYFALAPERWASPQSDICRCGGIRYWHGAHGCDDCPCPEFRPLLAIACAPRDGTEILGVWGFNQVNKAAIRWTDRGWERTRPFLCRRRILGHQPPWWQPLSHPSTIVEDTDA